MPKPTYTNVICDTCGMPWKDHKKISYKVPHIEDERAPESECIRLLKEKLANTPVPREGLFK